MKQLSMILILVAGVVFCIGGETVAVETGVYHGEAITCTSTDPRIGAQIAIMPAQNCMFASGTYDSAFVEQQLGLMGEWGMHYVRVFDGRMLSAENTFLPGVQANITDFLNRAQNHGLTVFFTFSSVEPDWMYALYQQRTGDNWVWDETEFNTVEGRRIYGDKIKYVTQQCFASRTEDIVISVRNEAVFNANMPLFGLTIGELAALWTDEMDAKVRSVDTRANHKVAVGLLQNNVGAWPWSPSDLAETNIEILDIHMTTSTSIQEFDSLFGSWAGQYDKDIVVGEMNVNARTTPNPKIAAQDMLNLIHHIRDDNRYVKITDVLFWTLAPYYKTYHLVNGSGAGAPDGPFHPLTDGYTGFTRLGVTLRYDQYVAETCSANYPVCSSYVTSNLTDYDENTPCILRNIPTVAYPSIYEVDFNGQWYRFHKIRVVDKVAPAPRTFHVEYFNGSTWEAFGDPNATSNNNQQVVDVVSTAASGWNGGCKIRIVVTNEFGYWSSLSEIYVNPVITVECSANYPIYEPEDEDVSYIETNFYDGNEDSQCVLMHIPTTQAPSRYEIDCDRMTSFHKIRIVDKTAPAPRDFRVYVYNGSSWEPFGNAVTGNTSQTVDVVSTDASGWQQGSKIRIEVTNESGNWSSLHEVYINP